MPMQAPRDRALSDRGGRRPDRVIGEYGDHRLGPTVIVIGGLHGNEPAGAHAAERVIDQLHRTRPRMQGRLLALRGNRTALARKQRYLVRDLNRRWTADGVRELLARDPAHDEAEDAEQRELLEILHTEMRRSDQPLVLLDLHSTSGECPPFCCMSDALRNRTLAFALGVPVILGLEEVTDATLMGYLADMGHVGVAFEAGQHVAPETEEKHVAAIALALAASGLLAVEDVPDHADHVRRLRKAARGNPRVVEIVYRHAITPEDQFEMEPGFTSFQRLEAGQVLARDRDGEVRAAFPGRMLLPLYQGLGEDGFFIGRDVGPVRLRLSQLLRRARLDDALALLPGVRRARPDDHNHLLVARGADVGWLRDALFLCGFRHARPAGDRVVYSRRRPDADGLTRDVGE